MRKKILIAAVIACVACIAIVCGVVLSGQPSAGTQPENVEASNSSNVNAPKQNVSVQSATSTSEVLVENAQTDVSANADNSGNAEQNTQSVQEDPYLSEELRTQVTEYVSVPEKSQIAPELVNTAVNEFAMAYYNYDFSNVSSGSYQEALSKLLAYQALDDARRLIPVRARISGEDWVRAVTSNAAARSALVNVDSIQQVETFHDGLHDHMIAVELKVTVDRNVSDDGTSQAQQTSQITSVVFLDSEFDIADFVDRI